VSAPPAARRPAVPRRVLLVVLVVCALLAGVVGVVVDHLRTGDDPAAQARAAGSAFLETYVDDDGRVVRRDEGGDTVSEGQAYALLVATALSDEERVRTVWAWTRRHLMRDDGLLSWRWNDGSVIDPASASDADLDAARALVLAGQRFADPALTAEGVHLAAAVLDDETAPVGRDRLAPGSSPPSSGYGVDGSGTVLTAGSWVRAQPFTVNPGYFSPRADQLLGDVTTDPRWAQMSRTQRAVAWQLVGTGRLPPDWAVVETAGGAEPAPGPPGTSPRFGLDAARLPVRMAESCDPDDRAVAAATFSQLDGPDAELVGALDLNGAPLVEWTHPTVVVASAAAAHAAGHDDVARDRLNVATDLDERSPTYFGSAWVSLGRIMLDTDLLGPCSG
jgi:endoglucanase